MLSGLTWPSFVRILSVKSERPRGWVYLQMWVMVIVGRQRGEGFTGHRGQISECCAGFPTAVVRRLRR